MPRFPFGSRPTPRRPQQQPMRAVQPQAPPDRQIGYGDIIGHASFSPELSFLLAMTMKDGLSRQTTLEMLKKIEPYVSTGDKEAIHSIFSAQHMAEEYRLHPHASAPNRSGTGLNSFSRLARQQALLDVLTQYAGSDTKTMMQGLSQSAHMQDNFERMTRRMEKLRNMNASSSEQMFEALSMFMPPEEQGKFRNMQNMMRMMGSMGSFKPEDMFKFMGNMGGMGNMGNAGGFSGNSGNSGNMGGFNNNAGNPGNMGGFNNNAGNMGYNTGHMGGNTRGGSGSNTRGHNNSGNNTGGFSGNSGYSGNNTGGFSGDTGYSGNNTGGFGGNMGNMGGFSGDTGYSGNNTGGFNGNMGNMGGMGNMNNMMNMMNMMGNMMGGMGKRK